MPHDGLRGDFYDWIKPHLHRRIGRELRLAGRVLDIGCGSCELAGYLADTYRQQVTGVDISSKSFPKQLGPLGSGRIDCIQKDAADLDFVAESSMDAVVAVESLHEMKQPNGVLREAYRVLRPGGEMLIVDFPRDSLAQKLWNENYYSPGEVKEQLVRAGFYDIQVRLIEREQVIWARGFRPPVGTP